MFHISTLCWRSELITLKVVSLWIPDMFRGPVLCCISRSRENTEKEGALSVGSYSNKDGSLLHILNEKLSDYIVGKEKGTSNTPTPNDTYMYIV